MKVNKKVAKKILELPLRQNHSGYADFKTIEDYLKGLLTELIRDGECFSGKYPLGNSGWQYDLYCALYDGCIIQFDPLDLDVDFDYKELREADQIIMDVIKYL